MVGAGGRACPLKPGVLKTRKKKGKNKEFPTPPNGGVGERRGGKSAKNTPKTRCFEVEKMKTKKKQKTHKQKSMERPAGDSVCLVTGGRAEENEHENTFKTRGLEVNNKKKQREHN